MKKIVALFLACILLLSFGTTCFAESDGTFENWYYQMVYETIKENYPFEMNHEAIAKAMAEAALSKHPDLLEDLIAATTNELDAHSTYFTPNELDSFTDYIDAEYVGIGVVVERGKGAVFVSGIIPGSPAEQAGLLPGDRFLKVDGQDVTSCSVDQLSAVVRGPEGSAVELTLERDGKILVFTLVRSAVRQSTIDYDMLAKGIGYLRISMFASGTAADLAKADKFFKENKAKKLMIDLRDNPGGELVSVINCLGYFVPQGKSLVKIKYGDESRNRTLRSVGDVVNKCYYNKIVVLVNENTASAAELFAGNIQHYKLGKLVGTTTYGKGTVQEIVNLMHTEEYPLGAIKFTTAEYFLPGDKSVNKVGITPDYHVPNRRVRLDTSQMEEMVYCSAYTEGNTGKGVLAIKQRMDALGFDVGELNEVYDAALTEAVWRLQGQLGSTPTGVMDIETQTKFSNLVNEARITYDDQFDRAYELLK